MKKLIVIVLIYSWVPIANAQRDIVIINQPDGKQTICTVLKGLVTCF
jgi:hypothetical protein